MKEKILWIIGANSEIAKSFTISHAHNFKKTILASRDLTALRSFSGQISDACVDALPLDLADPRSIADFINRAETPDVVLLCAGHVRYQEREEDCSEANIHQTLAVNMEGPIALLEAIAPALREKETATVLALGSCAGERGKASNRVYAASKGGLTVYMEGFMQKHQRCGIHTVLILLGHVSTRTTQEILGPSPLFSCSPEKAASYIWSRLKKDRSGVYVFPRIWKPLVFVLRQVPLFLYTRIKL